MWLFGRSCQSTARLSGKTVIITGANTGIGKETARDLYWRGARVIMACRNVAKANDAVEELKKTPPSNPGREQFKGEPGELVVCELNLCSLASVRKCAETLNNTESAFHILINNAGVLMCPYEETEDGFEKQFQSNYLGHFLFTLLLLPKMKASAPGCRIINLSSIAHIVSDVHFDDINLEKSISPIFAYGQSKWSNILFTKELARRLKEAHIEGITTYVLHPGVVSTELVRHLSCFHRFLFLLISVPKQKTPELGAQTTIHCAVDEAAGKETGLYYKECAVTSPFSKAQNEQTAVRLFNESLKFVGLPVKDNLAELLTIISNDIGSA